VDDGVANTLVRPALDRPGSPVGSAKGKEQAGIPPWTVVIKMTNCDQWSQWHTATSEAIRRRHVYEKPTFRPSDAKRVCQD
jgi:hypothetical protein